ncbi:hypothetical protein [Bacillus kwashiorkori]|uniref:hypothetical protein n=1 Tax=Bacillus kwashiorkori TaxID=1522318 RepID=UPI0007838EB9|nr:hypothetical protein [Bacillus kwashiorkori]
MISKRHFLFNIAMIVIPWLSLLFFGKQNFKRYSIAGISIICLEIVNHLIGYARNWWSFYSKRKSFLTNELPFSIGPYMPLSMWILRFTFGNFKKFIFVNAIFDGIFAYFFIEWLSKIKILTLNKLSNNQFFFYLFYKAFILYGIQYLVEGKKMGKVI